MFRSLLAGTVAGMLVGWLIFYIFGFVGMTSDQLGDRLHNGWVAAFELGIGRGARVGIGIAIGLAASSTLWLALTRRFDTRRARPLLAASAAAAVILGNLTSIRRFQTWDEVAIVTVVFMSLLTAAAVWLVSPWVLKTLN
ncbi:MAG: hypothetical protein ACRDZM_12765 [Acidimicrobiia bacterium]